MRIDAGPLNDVRVRQALRLLADRQAFVDQILNGFGQPGDDLPCRGAKYYADEFKREQDVEQAKSLLKAAGQENLSACSSTRPTSSTGWSTRQRSTSSRPSRPGST